MTDRANGRRSELDSETDARAEPAVPDAVETVEVYETDEGMVLYDAENPLAWVQSSGAISLEDAA
ncbi:MAG: hypothetical protein ABEJ31_02765 [Haloarculaceae archaeon]